MKKYITGYVLSIVLTVAAYGFTQWHLNSSHQTPSDALMLPIIASLAILQVFVQLFMFLHLGNKSLRWNRVTLVASLGVVLLIVFGTIWIMDNLEGNMHDPHEMTPAEIIEDEGFQDSH